MTRDKQAVEAAIQEAFGMQNVPYIWGGFNAKTGVDCSGFVMLILIASGIVPYGSAKKDCDGLYAMTKQKEVSLSSVNIEDVEPGCLVFYSSRGIKNDMTHVMLSIGGGFCIGAQGGNKNVTYPEYAVTLDARVKILPIMYRSDIMAITDPYMEV